jgi:hypothetical protein
MMELKSDNDYLKYFYTVCDILNCEKMSTHKYDLGDKTIEVCEEHCERLIKEFLIS